MPKNHVSYRIENLQLFYPRCFVRRLTYASSDGYVALQCLLELTVMLAVRKLRTFYVIIQKGMRCHPMLSNADS